MNESAGRAGREPVGNTESIPITEHNTQQLLRQIVSRLTADRALREDLLQEASVHLWLRQKNFPGQTRSWYLQSCRFFLQNFLRNGRSLDSNKRTARACPVSNAQQQSGNWPPHPIDTDALLGLVSAREIAHALQKYLTPVECGVFTGLAEGSGIREIACRLGVSHTSVLRYRDKIASLALRLGVEPMPRRTASLNSIPTP